MSNESGSADALRTAWRTLADQIGGEYLGRRHQRPDTVQLRHGDCMVTLDAMDGARRTRMRAPFINPSGFRFMIYDEGLIGRLGKKLVLLQDLDVGHPNFDRRFMVQSVRPEAVRELLRDERVRDRIWRYVSDGGSVVPGLTWKVRFGISEDDGLLGGGYAPEVDVLQFETVSQITSVDRLAGLFELFKAILDHVTLPDGREDEVEREIRRLRAPGGIVTGRVTLWEGDPPRHDAADNLGRLGDPRAVPVLLGTLVERDPVLKAKAVHALGEIGDERALPMLIRLLGMRQGQLKRKLCDDAADALVAMGEEDAVVAFADALDGRAHGLPAVMKTYRTEVIEGLIVALEGPGRSVEVNIVAALERIGAVEALPQLRRRVNSLMLTSVRDTYRRAIEALESRASLPRPVEPVGPRSKTLPKPTDGATRLPTDTLPKATDL